MHYLNSERRIFDTSGQPLPNETTNRLSTLLWQTIEEAFEFSVKANETEGGRSIPKEDPCTILSLEGVWRSRRIINMSRSRRHAYERWFVRIVLAPRLVTND
jgi:hypothetical protein